MEKINDWINSMIKGGNVPRVSDVLEFARHKKIAITKKAILKAIHLNPIYTDNLHQERDKKRSGKQMPIISNTLGDLHADLGYYSVVRAYPTPKTYQYGFFVAKDVLSRFIYVELMLGPKSADNLIKVLKRLLIQHKKNHPDYDILSISFDKEKAMMGKKVRSFLQENNIKFFYFELSATKAKVAENGIKLLRTEVQRLINDDKSGKARWWNLLPLAAKSLNEKEIKIRGKKTGYRPVDVNADNVKSFLKKMYKLVPGYYFAQFNLPRQLVKYKFEIEDIVRPKIITTSSQVIGNKTSQVNLDVNRFQIVDRYPFITTDLSLKRCYKCLNIKTGEIDIFSEEDLALSL